jgi:beta-glucosidase
MVSLKWPIAVAILARLAHAEYDYQASVEWRTGNTKVDALIDSMTPEQKVIVVQGFSDTYGNQQQAGYTEPIESLGIPTVRLTDGEAGVNIVENSTAPPMQINVAATWSLDAAYNHGVIGGKEAKLFNLGVLLYPRVNILRDIYEGNFWQSYSEDPYLNARLGVQGVVATQAQGTMADAKQIGPSQTGASGSTTNSIVDMQVLHEVYWVAPGTLLQEGNAATLMCSYTQVNGVQACQYQPLFDTVRNDYGSKAIVMSDWTATHATAESLIAGMDLEMPTGAYYGALYDYIYVSQNLSESYLDRALGHILAKYDEFGLLNTTTGNSSALPADVIEEHGALAYDIAVKSGVLLKNDNNTLPLGNRTFAVIGPNGVQYSHGTNFAERAYGIPERLVSPLDALRARLGDEVPYTVGVDQEGSIIPSTHLRTADGKPGLVRSDGVNGNVTDEIVYFSGVSALEELEQGDSYTWSGQLHAETAGYYTISLARAIPRWQNHTNADYGPIFAIGAVTINGTEADGYRLYGDGGVKPWSNSIATRDNWDNIKAYVYLEEGWHDIEASIVGVMYEPVSVRLTWVTPEQRATNIQLAVDLAKEVDTPVVFAFANSPAQTVMTLDDGLDELIEKVAAVNPNTVVVLNNAEPVAMPWLASVAAVLEMMYPNQEGGWATADLLLGNHNPQGRLPVTYPTSADTSLTRNPDYPGRIATDDDNNATFSEGINSGYRWYHHINETVLFPFGYGLSYTSFEYSNANFAAGTAPTSGGSHYEVSCSPDNAEAKFSVAVTVTNTGSVKGVEVPQIYIGPPSNAETAYPDVQFASIALVGFGNVELEAGESATLTIGVREKQLSFYNTTSSSWQLVTGERPVYVAKSVEDVVFAGTVTL